METQDKFKELVEKIETMSVLELNDFVKVLEARFGVSASAMVAAPASNAGAVAEAVEEKDSFAVHLLSVGSNKIAVIKALKEALGLGLKEVKDLTDAVPSLLKEGVKKDEADKLKAAIEAAGGSVELK